MQKTESFHHSVFRFHPSYCFIATDHTVYILTNKSNKIIEVKNKAYIEGFGYVGPAKTKTIIVDSDGNINKMVGEMN